MYVFKISTTQSTQDETTIHLEIIHYAVRNIETCFVYIVNNFEMDRYDAAANNLFHSQNALPLIVPNGIDLSAHGYIDAAAIIYLTPSR